MKKILYVYAPAGPPLDYSFPKIAARAEVTTCIVSPPSAYNRAVLERHSHQLIDLSGHRPEQAMEAIEALADTLRPDVLFTFSEFLLKAITEIAARRGLRSVGPNVELARNKIDMRDCWARAGVPQPAYRAIRHQGEMGLIGELTYPVLVKLAYGAGSIGQQVVRQDSDIDGAISKLLAATEAARALGKHEFSERHGFPQLIAEEIIVSSTDSWYQQDGYGDYLSIEGLVKDGTYYPLAMTGRLRTIAPFTELGNVAPCILSAEKKQRLVELITLAVNALGFDNCATHTELKLMPDGTVSFLETAARMGGVAIAKELDAVFGLDYVDLFIGVLLGDAVIPPAFEASTPRQAAASVALIGCDSQGTPWKSARRFSAQSVDWHSLVDGLATVQIESAQSMPDGGEIKPYDAYGGVLNYAGQAFLVADDPAKLQRAAYLLLDRLEQHLPPYAAHDAEHAAGAGAGLAAESGASLLMIHGLLGSINYFSPATHLAGLTLHTPDQLGYGVAAHATPASAIDLYQQAKAIVQFIRARGAAPVWLLGHSVGGAVAMLVADLAPELVAGLISVEGNFTLNDAFWCARIAATPVQQWEQEYRLMAADPAGFLARAEIAPTAERLAWAQTILANQDSATVHAMATSVIAVTGAPAYLELVRRVLGRTPLTLLAGAHSAAGWDVPDWVRAAARADLVLPGTGHMLMLEDPAGFCRSVRALIEAGTRPLRSAAGAAHA